VGVWKASVFVVVISRVILDVCRCYTADRKYSSGCMNTFETVLWSLVLLVLLDSRSITIKGYKLVVRNGLINVLQTSIALDSLKDPISAH